MKINSLEQQTDSAVSHNPKIRKKVLIASGLVDGLTNFSQARFPAGEIAAKHQHPDMTEVFFIVEGCGVIEVDEEIIKLSPGVCVTIEPGEHHEIRNTGNRDLVVNYFGLKH